MSGTIFMSYEGVDGEAQDLIGSKVSNAPAGGAWIGLLSCDFGGSAAYAQETTRERGQFQIGWTATITKEQDGATLGLLRAALDGGFDKNVVITFARQGDGTMIEFLRLELTDCGIFDFDLSGADRPVETYKLHFGEIQISSWAIEGSEQRAPAVTVISNKV